MAVFGRLHAALLMVFVLVGCAAAVEPYEPPPGPKLSLVDSLREQGYPAIRNVQASAEGLVVDVVTDAGLPATVLVDPSTTQVVEVLSDE